MKIIDKNIDRIRVLCSKYKVTRLFVFGSILTDKFKESSDIDFLVDFEGVDLFDYADNYFDLKKIVGELIEKTG